jgi:hypothetical protein
MRQLLIALALLVLSIPFSPGVADIPTFMSYQGLLRDGVGDPVADGAYSITFRLYDVEIGGTALWTETQTVTVADGVFNAKLGKVTPLSTLDFVVPYWLGISVGADPEMTPRVELATSPYAGHAGYADRAGEADHCEEADADWTIDGDNVYHDVGDVGIGLSTMDAKLDVLTGDRMCADFSNGSGDGNFTIRARNYGATAGGFYAGIVDSPYPTIGAAVYGVGGDGHLGGHFISRGSEVGLEAETEGPSPALKGVSHTDAYAGYFQGGSGLFVENTAEVGGFRMESGASAGYVLTADASGYGSWQPASGGGITGSGTGGYLPLFLNPTMIGNSYVYQDGFALGIGTQTPAASLNVIDWENKHVAGRFDVVSQDWEAHGVEGVCTAGLPVDQSGVYGWSAFQDDYGKGGEFYGGYCGAWGAVDPVGSSAYPGVVGEVLGQGGSNNQGTNVGVSGHAQNGGTNYGVYGYAGGGTTNKAGYFSGDVQVTGLLSKGGGSFKIDHPLDPEGKYLYHSFVESPDMMNVYNGNVELDLNGEAWVELPDWFEALNGDFRYQLTPIGAPGPNLYVAEKIRDNRFRIAGGKPGMEVSWMVTGIRHDPFAEANRIPVEEAKPASEAGRYLHPEVYGRSDAASVDPLRRNPLRRSRSDD